MATEDSPQSPFTRPGFIAATVVVALVVVLGLVLAIINATRDGEPSPASPSPTPEPSSSAPATEPPADTANASVCGLEGEVLSGSLTTAPDSQWEYQGVTSFPTSSTYGPGKTDDTGVRSCFQHSPTGALFAAASGLVQATDSATASAWLERALAEGPYRDEILAGELAGEPADDAQDTDVRLAIAGFRLLNYDGGTARIDIAVTGSSEGTGIVGSFVYELVWQGGDWKLSADTASPFSYATLPDLAGYITWKG